MKSIFWITNAERAKIEKWSQNHDCIYMQGKRPSNSPLGGEISVIFTPTELGTVVSVKCLCGNESFIRRKEALK